MSEFDMLDMTPEQPRQNSSGSTPKRSGGGWYFPLSLLGLVMVGGLSILMCFLTDFMRDRSVWIMGLIFMVPAGAMFFAAMLLEFSTNAMTPNMSRKPQVIVAVIATVLTFLVGCLCDAIYLYSGVARDAGVQFVLAVDRGDTRDWPVHDGASATRGEELNGCAASVLAKMPEYTDVGMLTFGWDVIDQTPMTKADFDFKVQFPGKLESAQSSEGVSYANMLDAAIAMAEQADNDLPTRILIFTGGDEAVYLINAQGDVHDTIGNVPDELAMTLSNEATRNRLIDRCVASDITLYTISPFGDVSEGLRDVVFATGGMCVSLGEAVSVPEFISITEVDSDMLRSSSLSAKILTGVMLLLEGVVIGVCISIMLSRQGQKRFQMILSPLMGIVSFVMLKLLGTPEANPFGVWWLWEGVSFLPMGLIFMCSNRGYRSAQPAQTVVSADPFGGSQEAPATDAAFGDDGFSGAQSSDNDWNL